MKKVAFHSYQLGERGTEVHMYKMAKYNREILGNESIIISTSSRPHPSLPLFKEFPTFLYPEVWVNDGVNLSLRTSIEKICELNKVTHMWSIKQGENDGILPINVKNFVSSIGGSNISKHGDVFTFISEYLADIYKIDAPVVHPIVELEDPQNFSSFREELGIPKDALVLGRHGGKETFDLPFVKSAIEKALNQRSDLYFVFANTNMFYQHDRIFHLDYTSDFTIKSKFINTCDAMIHARSEGEIFSLSLAEFATRNKPILSWKPTFRPHGYSYGHYSILGDRAIWYRDENDLYDILVNLSSSDIRDKDWDVYKDNYSPKKIMTDFNNLFLEKY